MKQDDWASFFDEFMLLVGRSVVGGVVGAAIVWVAIRVLS